jgi:hypothetical protein
MSTKILYKYRYFSTLDSNFNNMWAETPPTGSNIDTNSITIIDQISDSLIQIQNDYNNTNGNYMLEGFTINVPAQSNYTSFKIFPMPISCYNVYCYPTQSNVNDSFSCYLPLPTVPVLGNVSIGSSNIPIPSALTSYVNVGYNVALSNSSNLEQIGRVISIDTSNNVLYTEYCSSNSYSYPNDQVVIKAYFVKDLLMPVVNQIIVGQGTLNGTFVPKNTPVLIEYSNNSCTEKKMTYHVEYMY